VRTFSTDTDLLLQVFVHSNNKQRGITLHTREMCKKLRIIRVDMFYVKKNMYKKRVIESQNISHKFRSQAVNQELEHRS